MRTSAIYSIKHRTASTAAAVFFTLMRGEHFYEVSDRHSLHERNMYRFSRYIIDRLEGKDGREARAMMDTESATELLAVD
jgi:hypothetical protein